MHKTNKKVLSTVVGVLMLINLISTISPKTVNAEVASDGVKITILGTSDIHGRYMPWDYSMDAQSMAGSLTQIYTKVKSIRNENPNTILVDAGDLIQDNSAELFNNSPKHPAMVALNEMGYDVWNMGNHEFNFGLDVLSTVTKQFNGKVISGNIYKEDGSRFAPAYTIIEKEGVKIALIGMDTPLITQFEAGTDHLKGLKVVNPIDETKKVINELRGTVDAMVGIMHMGIDNENNIAGTGVRDIANACPELTAIVSGHMHKLVKQETINGVLITEPNKYGSALSKIDLSFKKVNGKIELDKKSSDAIVIDSSVQSDKGLEKSLELYHNVARADANTIVGQLKGIDLVPSDEINGIPQVQIQQTPLADFFQEVMLYYSKADVVGMQIDNDKAKLNVGPIKKKDISYNYQYAGGEVTVFELTGKDLKGYMEWSAGYFNSTSPGDVTVSFNSNRRASKYSTNDMFGGVKYEIDLTKQEGSRIVNLRHMNGTTIKSDEVLKLGMNDYRMQALIGKGGVFEGKTFKKLWSSTDKTAFGEEQGTIRNLAIRYIKEVKKGIITSSIQDNWRIIGVDTTSLERKDIVKLVNSGILEVAKTADGKYTNIASINIKDATPLDEISDLCKKANIELGKFTAGTRKGEFYHKLNAIMNPELVVVKPETPVSVKEKASKKYGVVTSYALNVRSGASAKSEVIGYVAKGEKLEVLGMTNKWVKISYKGKVGYVYSSYVKL
ncbi:5'-nucleotidase C-terminal domain-containing protein [Clostridium sp. FP1]|uniref:5'-nucleotidase C-terminal domain-containing protein n=1 Tax=Clostridium sp. FP1 TaxID=2724076 RepID=UPI00192D5935|nr:5'-nucleotidase C-terminal domain-containing protein [Clostridium sp. FP1]MBZ9637362.1 5'-nucleotidase C-terminal domain-containing protein [Clostridium sp. FP1]